MSDNIRHVESTKYGNPFYYEAPLIIAVCAIALRCAAARIIFRKFQIRIMHWLRNEGFHALSGSRREGLNQRVSQDYLPQVIALNVRISAELQQSHSSCSFQSK